MTLLYFHSATSLWRSFGQLFTVFLHFIEVCWHWFMHSSLKVPPPHFIQVQVWTTSLRHIDSFSTILSCDHSPVAGPAFDMSLCIMTKTFLKKKPKSPPPPCLTGAASGVWEIRNTAYFCSLLRNIPVLVLYAKSTLFQKFCGMIRYCLECFPCVTNFSHCRTMNFRSSISPQTPGCPWPTNCLHFCYYRGGHLLMTCHLPP